MSMSSINNFLSIINKNQGLAFANRFYINFSVPTELSSLLFGYSNDLQYQCETSEIPGKSLATTDYRTYGPSRRIASLTEYTPITFGIYCTNSFWEKPFFDTWIEYINPRNLGWDFRFKDQYATPLLLTQLDLSDNPIYQVRLRKAFPFAISSLPLSWTGDSVHQLQVSFAYDSYEPLDQITSTFNSTTGTPLQQGV